MVTLKQILNEIEELKKQEDKIRNGERAEMIAEVKKNIDLYQISFEELGFMATESPKYKRGNQVWNGLGHPPPWIRDYLHAGGNVEDLLINK